MHVVYLIEYPLGQRDMERLCIEAFRDSGVEVELWNCAPFLRPSVYRDYTPPDPISPDVQCLFFSFVELEDALLRLDSDVFIMNFIPFSRRTRDIYRTFAKGDIDYGWIMGRTLPDYGPSLFEGGVLKGLARMQRKNTPRKIFRRLCLSRRISSSLLGFQPARLVFAAGEEMVGEKPPMGPGTELVWVHAYDYETYRDALKVEPIYPQKPIVVFLDEFLPFHPDFIDGSRTVPVVPDEYYPTLCRFFDWIESEFNVAVVVAAHPRANYSERGNFFEGRDIHRGLTAELVKESAFVISHVSQSVNYPVLFKKPVLFTTTDSILKNAGYQARIDRAVSLLNGVCVNISKPDEWKRSHHALSVDRKAYLKYENDYIKRRGSVGLSSKKIIVQQVQRVIKSG